MWQKSGNQGDEWLQVQSHVNLQKVHQVVLEAAVGGEAGDIAIDDISLSPGACPVSGNAENDKKFQATTLMSVICYFCYTF